MQNNILKLELLGGKLELKTGFSGWVGGIAQFSAKTFAGEHTDLAKLAP